MSDVPAIIATLSLPALVDRAATALANARTAAEVLEARDMASVAYDAAKKAARLGKAKQAHDDLIAAAYRAQADALEIEARAKRKLADEYDAAQGRGEVATKSHGGANIANGVPEKNTVATVTHLGLSRKEIYDARIIRDAEAAEPGIVRRALDEALAGGEEPTKARVNRAVRKAAKRPARKPVKADLESQHDRDLRLLLGVWEAACASAREAFLRAVSNEKHEEA